jgi:hypothetical protein
MSKNAKYTIGVVVALAALIGISVYISKTRGIKMGASHIINKPPVIDETITKKT